MNDDRERTLFAAVLAVVGAVLFVAGALMTRLADVRIPSGCLLLVFGAAGVLQAVLVGLGLMPIPGKRDKDKNKDNG